jgi:hypothetical protein
MEEYGKFRDRRKSLTPDSFVLPTEAEKNRARRMPGSKTQGDAWEKLVFWVGVTKLQLQLQKGGSAATTATTTRGTGFAVPR